ncbi:MAG: DUF465 domain-containing protein [Thermodesulfobacteriota bacterium]
MEKWDLELIDKWKDKDAQLSRLWQEHLEFEEQLDAFSKRLYLSTAEEMEKKTIQKKKLQGRTEIERILIRLRKSEQG